MDSSYNLIRKWVFMSHHCDLLMQSMTGLSQIVGSYVQFKTLLWTICKVHSSDMIYTKLTTRGSYIYVWVKSNMYYYALLKCCAHNAETSCSKWCYAWSAETLTYMVKGRNVHTCSNSELDNVVITVTQSSW